MSLPSFHPSKKPSTVSPTGSIRSTKSTKSTVSNFSRVSSSSKRTNSHPENNIELIKKLTADKVALKEKLRKILTKMEQKKREYHAEKKSLEDIINNMSVQTHPEAQVSVKRLEHTIIILQERLASLTKATRDQEELHHSQIGDMQAHLASARQIEEAHGKLKAEHNKLIQVSESLAKDLEHAKSLISKNQEVDKIIHEKDGVINMILAQKEHAEKKLKITEHECDTKILEYKNQVEQTRLECERKISLMNTSMVTAVNDIKTECANKISEINRCNKLALDKVKETTEKEFKDKLAHITTQYNLDLETLIRTYKNPYE